MRNRTLAWRGKLGVRGIDENRATDAVAAAAHRGNTRYNIDPAHISRVDVGQGRIHVVAAVRRHGHSIDQHFDPVIGQPMNRR